jgi:uncharacterized protein YdaT
MSTHSTGQKTDHKTDQTKPASAYRSAAAIPLPTKQADPSKVDLESKHSQSNGLRKSEPVKDHSFSQKH